MFSSLSSMVFLRKAVFNVFFQKKEYQSGFLIRVSAPEYMQAEALLPRSRSSSFLVLGWLFQPRVCTVSEDLCHRLPAWPRWLSK
jgi:hypothetical protein